MAVQSSPHRAPVAQHNDPGADPLADASQRDALIAELEEHTVEGRGPNRVITRRELLFIVPLLLLATAAALIALHALAGWPAVGVGAILFAGYYILGGNAQYLAWRLRNKDHKRIEHIADEQLNHAHR